VTRAGAAFALAAAIVCGACAPGPAVVDYPSPPGVSPTTSTTVADYSGVALDPVPGRTTTTVDNKPGTAHLQGTVTGPDGAVPGATVHVERLVGDAVLGKDVTTAADGTWKLDLIAGGRYRVRAYRPPDLAQDAPQIFFLDGTETRTLALMVTKYTGTQAVAALAPTPPDVGAPTTVAITVSTVTVDPGGVVRGTPVAGASVQLLAAFGDWRIETSPIQITDPGGNAQWRATCLQPGDRPLSVGVTGSPPLPLSIPPCGAV
jgi:hypothetical protein